MGGMQNRGCSSKDHPARTLEEPAYGTVSRFLSAGTGLRGRTVVDDNGSTARGLLQGLLATIGLRRRVLLESCFLHGEDTCRGIRLFGASPDGRRRGLGGRGSHVGSGRDEALRCYRRMCGVQWEEEAREFSVLAVLHGERVAMAVCGKLRLADVAMGPFECISLSLFRFLSLPDCPGKDLGAARWSQTTTCVRARVWLVEGRAGFACSRKSIRQLISGIPSRPLATTNKVSDLA